MTDEDEKDLERFFEGLSFFVKMDGPQIMEHMKNHREDALIGINIRHSSGNGSMFCTSVGLKAFESLIKRRIEARIDGKNFDAQDVIHKASANIMAVIKEEIDQGNSPEDGFEKTLNDAIKLVQTKQKKITYHFPCVLASANKPEEFSIGPVHFTIAALFEKRLLALNPDEKKIDEKVRGKEFLDYIKSFGWMASVEVPPCSHKVSKQRAELAARTAINIVRVWFGLGHGKRMRLVHTEPATSGFSKMLAEDDEGLWVNWSRTFEGASVADDWFLQVVPGNIGHYNIASALLVDIVNDERNEIAERLIDALSWFGDAAFEPSPGATIAKLAMLLERLVTTTPTSSTRRFCRRVAILALEDENDLISKYWDAYAFYNARSSITHGEKSQFDTRHWIEFHNAQRMITNCLFSAMEIYSLLKHKGKNIPETLHGFFDQQETRHVAILKELDNELGKKEKIRKAKFKGK